VERDTHSKTWKGGNKKSLGGLIKRKGKRKKGKEKGKTRISPWEKVANYKPGESHWGGLKKTAITNRRRKLWLNLLELGPGDPKTMFRKKEKWGEKKSNQLKEGRQWGKMKKNQCKKKE